MSVTLSWSNSNFKPSSIRIYRSNSPISDINVGEVIATLVNSETSFTDIDVVNGSTLYYQVEVFQGDLSIKGKSFKVYVDTDYGIGGQEILAGDSVFGYMGSMSASSLGYMFSDMTSDVVTLVYKFIRNGKIIFTPGICRMLTPTSMENKGLLSSGVIKARGSEADKDKWVTIDINGRLYYPRVAKFYDDGNLDLVDANYGSSITPKGKSELIDLYSVFSRTEDETTRIAPIRIRSSKSMPAISNYNPVFSCDWASASKNTLVSTIDGAFKDPWTLASIGMSSAGISLPILEYIGVKK